MRWGFVLSAAVIAGADEGGAMRVISRIEGQSRIKITGLIVIAMIESKMESTQFFLHGNRSFRPKN